MLVKIARWPILVVLVGFALALLYRYGPSRKEPRWRWVTWGSGLATVVWIAASILFSWYVASFGSYNKTYGSLGAIIGFMTWIWISLAVVLLGAKLDAEMEHQTARDTRPVTKSPSGPVGQRWRIRLPRRAGDACGSDVCQLMADLRLAGDRGMVGGATPGALSVRVHAQARLLAQSRRGVLRQSRPLRAPSHPRLLETRTQTTHLGVHR